jgi:hypothetical protein
LPLRICRKQRVIFTVIDAAAEFGKASIIDPKRRDFSISSGWNCCRRGNKEHR